MKELMEAIYYQYTDVEVGSALRSLVSAFHFEQAPPKAALPIVVFNIIGASTDYTINDDEIDTYTLQFTIYAKTYIEAMAIYAAVNTAYQIKALTYSSGNQVVCRRETMIGPTIMEDAYQITTDYHIMYHLA
jgi:hypothetical protein|tara:strand:+ start:364 stop:759 length:396 start_codon:yes stop_codon:yes gene_type:complete